MKNGQVSLLIDLDGVLRIGSEPAPHVEEFFDFIRETNIHACIISNTTGNSANSLYQYFEQKGFNISHIPVLTALDATVEYARKHYKSVQVYVKAEAENHFSELNTSEKPEAVVIGDLEHGWSYKVMNNIFRKVMNGAEIVAMQKNKFWKTDEGLSLDAGSFIAAIEFATGKEAAVMGKPSEVFFKTALDKAGHKEGNAIYMLGDDLNSDLEPVQKLGGKGILAMSGKTTREMLEESDVEPDFVVENLNGVIEIMKGA